MNLERGVYAASAAINPGAPISAGPFSVVATSGLKLKAAPLCLERGVHAASPPKPLRPDRGPSRLAAATNAPYSWSQCALLESLSLFMDRRPWARPPFSGIFERGGRLPKGCVTKARGDEDVPTPTVPWILLAAFSFHVAYGFAPASFLIVLYLFALARLTQARTWRGAFYAGLAASLLIAAVWLAFFWRIFSASAIALWCVYAFWIGLFAVLGRLCCARFGSKWMWLLLPFLWCGLEYFRSELYFLRFSWLTPGFAFAAHPSVLPFGDLGGYGIGFALMLIAAGAAASWPSSKARAAMILVLGCAVLRTWGWVSESKQQPRSVGSLKVAGVQLEFPTEKQVCSWLNELVKRHPQAELLVLSEYTFDTPLPDSVKAWCREHKRYLVIGAKDPVSPATFFNTAFVISPDGEVVFRQVKAVPIQFFKDGLPAPAQAVWQSPWGKIGICICYDLSYTRVTDRLVRQGAQLILAPTMDVEDWGKRQHELHARIAPVRSAEYRIPIFRLASSGISQAVDGAGRVTASAPCPAQGAMLFASLVLPERGQMPLDRWLAPLCSAISGLVCVALITQGLAAKARRKSAPVSPTPEL